MNIKSNILIVSAFHKDLPYEVNRANHVKAVRYLKDVGAPHVVLTGKYEGIEEPSILVEGFENRVCVEEIAKAFNQECYLESHNDRATFLVFPNGSKQAIGTLVPVSKEEAEKADGYSYNPVVDQYYVTR